MKTLLSGKRVEYTKGLRALQCADDIGAEAVAVRIFMETLNSGQRKKLRALAHNLKPLVYVGKQGLTDTVVKSVDDNLAAHELIKVKFIEQKEEREEISAEIARRTRSELAGIIGNVAILYRAHRDPEKRRIELE
ncbi:MAG: ribosome assembly RNA-binding protein YhbY [Candidatus Hydrogenedentales bacterium]